MKHAVATFAVAVAAVAACAPASVEGSVLGEELTAADAVLVDDALLGVVVVISSVGGLCSDASGDQRALRLNFVNHNATGVELAPGSGDFTAVSQTTRGNELLASYLAGDGSSCVNADAVADDGIATIDSLSRTNASGTFDISFGDDRVKGSFNAPSCPASSFKGLQPCQL